MGIYSDAYREFWGRYSRVEQDRIRRELKRKGIKPLTPIELGHLKSLLREYGIDDWVSEVDPYISYEENVEQIEQRFGSLPQEKEFSLSSFARSVGEGFCDYVHELVEELMREEPDALKYIAELGYKDVDSFLNDVVKEGILPEYEIEEIKEAYGKKPPTEERERKPEKEKIEKKPTKEEKIKIGAGWDTIVGYNTDFIKALFPDWKWDKKKGTLTAPNEKIVMHALFSEIAPELEPHKTEILHIFNNLRTIFEKLGYELAVERPEEGKRVFFERARKDLKRLYDILGLEFKEPPSEEEAMKEKKEFVKEKLKAVFTAYLKGGGVSTDTIEKELKEEELIIESLAEAVASGRMSQSEAIRRLEEFLAPIIPAPELEIEEEEEEEEEGYLPVVRPAIPRPPKRKPAKRAKRIRKVEEVTPEILEPSAIAEKILREYPDELLAFGVRWVCENRRRELGFVDGANLEQVAWWLTKELRKKGDKIMARARRGVEYAAGMLLANQPDVIVRENIRQAMKREWNKIRTFVSVNYPDVLDKLGGKDLQLIILGYVYKLLGSPYAGMPEDIRKALRTFEKLYGD